MKPPEIPHLDPALVDKAVSTWKQGGLVAIPTETVYGLAADASNGVAVARIYQTKQRPQFNPLIVHVADIKTAHRYVEWTPAATHLAEKFWPGPMTLVMKRRADCPISELVSAGGDTLAIRMPSHPATQQLLEAFGGGLAAPSANRSGRVSPTTAQHVREEFGDELLVIDGGPCRIGIESTVIDLTGDKPVILRPGVLTDEKIESIVGPLGQRTGHKITAPGMLESHYAPSIRVRLNASDLAANEALLAFGKPLNSNGKMLNLSPAGDLAEAAANLFAYLRALDDAAYAGIAVMPIPSDGIGEAINDRLRRAAA